MLHLRNILVAAAAPLLLATALSAAPAPADSAAATAAQPAVRPVDPKTVCMVNDHAMGQPQIAVVVEEKTYYGCCEGCRTRLAEDAGVRVAIDPVTGQEVDKAKAVIGELPDGKVLYFASAENLQSYADSKK